MLSDEVVVADGVSTDVAGNGEKQFRIVLIRIDGG